MPAGELSILVVDDDEMMLHMLPPHLEKLGSEIPVARVQTATSPADALAALASLPDPLAVLSDYNLRAEMNGLQLLTEVARRRPRATRVLFSGYAREQIGDVGSGGVAHGFVEKPLRIREMIEPIRRIIDARVRDSF